MLIFGQYVYIYVYIFANDMPHDTLSQLYQKLGTY